MQDYYVNAQLTLSTYEWSLVQMTAGFLLKTITDLVAFVT